MTQPRHAGTPPVRRRELRANERRRTPLRTASTAPARRGPSAPRHAGSRARHRLRATAVVAVGLLAFTGTAVAATYNQLQGAVSSIDVGGLVDPPSGAESAEPTPPADPNAGTPLNILIVGSDSRADGAIDDGETSVLADTHIIAHISADRSRVELVSIPRDIMIDIPECRTTSDTTVYARFGMYNSAFAEAYVAGGDTESAIACDINLAQSVTGLTIDGFVLVEMGGFVEMVDALGGVDICIPEAIDAPKANLVLEAGQQTLTGEDALGYARARIGEGLNGSDTGRIERQQHLMSAMVDEVLSRNLLADGPALYKMLTAALGSLTMSPNLSSLTDMTGLALSLRSLSMENVTFMTTPFAAYPQDPNRLIFTSDVDAIWAAMAADTPITGEAEAKPEATAEPGAEATTDDVTTADATQPASDTAAESPDDVEGAEAATADDADSASAEDLNPVC